MLMQEAKVDVDVVDKWYSDPLYEPYWGAGIVQEVVGERGVIVYYELLDETVYYDKQHMKEFLGVVV